MDVLTILKFWKPNTSKVASGTTASDGDCAETTADSTISDHLSEQSDDDDDDSFFELELALPSYNSKISLTPPCTNNSSKIDFASEEEKESELKLNRKPQTPISILRSASPKLRVFMFGRFNKKSKRVNKIFETESVSSSYSPKRNSASLFTVKFKIEDGSIVPKFTRSISNSSSISTSPKKEKQSSDVSSETSKRFSKDSIQKYINLIKPKSSKKLSDGEKCMASPTRPSTTSFPSAKKEKEDKQSSRFKAKCKQLGKCKSASATIGVSSPAVICPARNDHPTDGIESAILHCKRSLTSSKGHSSLSRCSSDPSHDKSIQVSEET